MRKSVIKWTAAVCIYLSIIPLGIGMAPQSYIFINAPVAEAAISIQWVVQSLASVGGAGAVVAIVAATTGLTGAAALVAALALLGGPFGILGGIVAVGGIALLCNYIGQYGVDSVMEMMANTWKKEGKSCEEIENEIDSISSWLVSDSTKAIAKEYVRKSMNP